MGVRPGDSPLNLILEAVHDREDDRKRGDADEHATRGEEADQGDEAQPALGAKVPRRDDPDESHGSLRGGVSPARPPR